MDDSLAGGPTNEYELRPVQGGFEIRGGRLEESLVFRDREIDIPIRMVGFLTCYTGGLTAQI